ncbi:MAG: MBL fold metallo-hydrolase [Spirochaetes bacterium]|jgi:glyoxylase-like metal-dependent hydrolase (beta-lactamase superfamily II)|nr:MBL fold metallo-hydrolase [Spirochaetota bacterium]HQL42440.1 MBL fold metallo-hydrolase [Spirochaetota bacterium]HQQ50749.1 MBL fold metallo-hydrolase [Spirochaetota bacterium]
MIIEQLLVSPMDVFCYLLVCPITKEAVLIDPAADFDTIMQAIHKHNAHVKYIINTHGHFDHTSGNDSMMKLTGAELLIHENDVRQLTGITNRLMSHINRGSASPKPLHTVKEGDTIIFGNEKLTVLHTPGHTPGGICLYSPGNIFTGDTLFTEGMGRTDLPGGSYQQIMESIYRILSLPDDTVVWPGHHYGRFPKSTVAEQKRYYMHNNY